MKTECTVAFEPWGGEYKLVEPDFLTIVTDESSTLEGVVYSGGFIQLFFIDEPISIVNSRGERVSI